MLSFHQFENEINVNVCNLNVNDQPIEPFQVKIEQDIHVKSYEDGYENSSF